MAFDFSTVSAPFRMQPGLRRLADGAAQLTPLSPGERASREKLAVLGAFPLEALVMVSGFDAQPALDALVAHAVLEHPSAFEQRGAASYHAARLGWSLDDGEVSGEGPAEIGACLRALPASWRLAGLLSLAFAEDFAILDGVTGTVPWLAVCLPSHWAPEDKVGRHFAEIHAPVADNATLLAAAEHLTRLVTAETRWERFVWTLTDDPRLHRHPRRTPRAAWDAALDADALAASTYFRSERQTFIPLPAQRQAIFTIHVEVRPLAEAIRSAGITEAAGRLCEALASMSPAVLDYRGLGPARERLLSWLAAQPTARQ